MIGNQQLARRESIWNASSVNTFGGRQDDLALHPTVKPTQLIADAILDVTKPGEIVLDGFLSSGTTLLAAARTKRRALGLEIDPAYVDVAVGRWIDLPGCRRYWKPPARPARRSSTVAMQSRSRPQSLSGVSPDDRR